MSQWIEFALRKEQFGLIIDCLESKVCENNNFDEIENCIYLIKELYGQRDEYNAKLLDKSGFKLWADFNEW